MSSNTFIAFTPGEPAGIGPDLCLSLLQHPLRERIVVIANEQLLIDRAHQLGKSLQTIPTSCADSLPANGLRVYDLPLVEPTVAGRLNAVNSRYVLNTLTLAIEGCLGKRYAALVTGPVHKGVINDAGISFSGHTEFLAQHTGGFPVMMLACPGLRVALATTHLPLSEVPRALTANRIEKVIRILHRDLVDRFRVSQPRILVCGVNPHAGEGGHLGREELDILEPCLDLLRAEGMQLEGPLPADSCFTPAKLEQADAVLAMFHDQGLPVLKHMGFGESVNITLGLPIVRTSVDHGTALELAGTGQVNPGSLYAALETAMELSGLSPT